MELEHLRDFLCVAEELSVSRAARRLNVSQPGLSRRMAALEEAVGVRLLERRRGGRVGLTEGGREFAEGARRALAGLEETVRAVRRNHGGGAGRLRVGYLLSAGQEFLIPALPGFRGNFPGVAVTLRELNPAGQLRELEAGELDLIFPGHLHRAVREGMETRTLASFPLALAVPRGHELERQGGPVGAEALGREGFVVQSERTFPGRRGVLLELGRRHGMAVRIVEEAESLAALLALVASGAGVALVPDHFAGQGHPGVAVLGLGFAAPAVEFAAVWRGEEPEAGWARGLVAEVMRGRR